ncbi:MAG: PhzF family phenazine biosynthesis protein [Oceanococcus sp.]
MTVVPIYQIDAFTSHVFGGNPAAIVPLDRWLSDAQLQSIAAENNLSETAFLVPDTQADYALRWFTPAAEVELCGHATLATAWHLFHQAKFAHEQVRFSTLSGVLVARKSAQGIEIDLPSRPSEVDNSLLEPITSAMTLRPQECWNGANAIAVYENESQIRSLKPDFTAVSKLHPKGLIVTAAGDSCDFVSRYFVPSYGIDEDPVTGSAHADLMPLWSKKLGRNTLVARQLSKRRGELLVELKGDRVALTGQCVAYLRGEIYLPE